MRTSCVSTAAAATSASSAATGSSVVLVAAAVVLVAGVVVDGTVTGSVGGSVTGTELVVVAATAFVGARVSTTPGAPIPLLHAPTTAIAAAAAP